MIPSPDFDTFFASTFQFSVNQWYENFRDTRLGVPVSKSYLCGMFVHKKKNPRAIVSVQVIDKSQGKYRVVKTIDSSFDTDEVEKLFKEGKNGFPHI